MQTSNFQIIVLGVCTALILVGIAVFASFGGLLGGGGVGHVVVWGTLDQETMQNALDAMRQSDKSFQDVTYVQQDPKTYDETLVNAMANGTSPDLFLLDDSNLNSFTDKIIPIPYNDVSQSTFLNSYISAGQLFLTPQGILALPFSIDPLVMYWNTDMFASAGLAQAPVYWNDFLDLSPKITSLNSTSGAKKSAVALGQWSNIDHAKDILATLFMQAGDPIVSRASSGAPSVVFGTTPPNYPANPAESALRFYTEFANPSKTSYSWNKALPEASSAFEAGDLAVYFGFASEYANIASLNPNLHFAVAAMPQIEGNLTKVEYGSITGLAIPRATKNAQGALSIAEKLTSPQSSALISQALSLPSVRRDVSSNTSANAAAQVFAQAALISSAWLDPSPAQSDGVFQGMIESVVSGASEPAEAVSNAQQELERLF